MHMHVKLSPNLQEHIKSTLYYLYKGYFSPKMQLICGEDICYQNDRKSAQVWYTCVTKFGLFGITDNRTLSIT